MPTPITINVNFIDLTGSAVNGYMQASIVSPTGVYDLYVTGTGIILPKITTSTVGTSVSVTVWGNDIIVDAADGAMDTYYTVNLFNTSNVLLWSAAYLFTGAGPINLVGYPILNPVPAPTPPSFPVVQPPGGSNTDVQYNNGGVFGGDGNFTYISGSQTVNIGATAGAGTLNVGPNFIATPAATSVINAVAATSGANQSSIPLNIVGQYWTGSISAPDTWSVRSVLGAGANPASTLTFTHSGSPSVSNAVSINFPITLGVINTVGMSSAGNINILNSFSLVLGGSASGNAQIAAAAAAGTPNKLLLPTSTGASGQVLTTDGSNPQQLSWTTPFQWKEVVLTLSSTQILNLAGTPVQILAAPGANLTYELVYCLAHYRYNTTAYTIGGLTTMGLAFTNSTSEVILSFNPTGVIDQTNDVYDLVTASGGSYHTTVVNSPLLVIADADPTLGDGTITFSLLYRTLDTTRLS